jgi:hypothetical protein
MSRIMRERQEDLADDIEALEGEERSDGSSSLLVQTVAESTYPTTPLACFACTPVTIDGEDTEGAAANFAVDDSGAILYAFNLGSSVPPVGTALVVDDVGGGRYVFRYD